MTLNFEGIDKLLRDDYQLEAHRTPAGLYIVGVNTVKDYEIIPHVTVLRPFLRDALDHVSEHYLLREATEFHRSEDDRSSANPCEPVEHFLQKERSFEARLKDDVVVLDCYFRATNGFPVSYRNRFTKNKILPSFAVKADTFGEAYSMLNNKLDDMHIKNWGSGPDVFVRD